ncbi:uncharacterized protein PV09_05604 [Verruconis gallopava]|uniref:Meiotic nuclear division protein 1 n=1 Tax=Verruconis gallopava TaxID=253628 RepID=A0A0D2AW61_9PEZI|nr:uncharacterized protein PV09_05604 [Verruconis gallopava]KIW03399.1 hypothetical protein PV09_05604 [Verruconis gallopava]
MTKKDGPSSAQKQALCVQWIQKSRVAHTIRDLEKVLPQVASINAMAVRDYIQAMADENMIRVEKIGSGNWYWSFPNDEKIKKKAALSKAASEKTNARAVFEDLQQHVKDTAAARKDEGDKMLMEHGLSRVYMTKLHSELSRKLNVLRRELDSYSKNDPVEFERRKAKVLEEKVRVDSLTDSIYNMESWLKRRLQGDKATMMGIKRCLYGDEYDEEVGGLRDITNVSEEDLYCDYL